MLVNRSGRNEQSLQRTFHRYFLPSFGSFGQTVSEEKNFKNQPIRNKNCLWRPCLLMDRDEMSNLYRGPSIDAPYQVSLHLAEGVSKEKIKMWKVNGQTTDAKWWQKLTLPLARWAKKPNQKHIFLLLMIIFFWRFRIYEFRSSQCPSWSIHEYWI